MGADRNLTFAGCDPLQRRAPRRSTQTARQQLHAHITSGKKSSDRRTVLFSKQLRWRHDRRLAASSHRRQHSIQRYRGLATTHVSLQQPIHGHYGGNVTSNLRTCTILFRRKYKRKPRPDPRVDRRRHRN